MPQAYFGLAILGLWIAWAVSWGLWGRTRKPLVRVEARAARARHRLPLLAGLVLMLGPGAGGAALAAPLWPRAGFEGPLGLVLAAAGLGFSLWARRHLAGNWSVQPGVTAGHDLVQSGPYALARHPIYTGILLALLGTVVLVDRWQALLGYALAVLSFVIKLGAEERFMEEQFGEAYRDYRRKVKALVPGLF